MAKQQEEPSECGLVVHFQRVSLFLILWVLLGLFALYTSGRCFFRGGTLYQRVSGILLAVVLGPLFFIVKPAMGVVDKTSGAYCA